MLGRNTSFPSQNRELSPLHRNIIFAICIASADCVLHRAIRQLPEPPLTLPFFDSKTTTFIFGRRHKAAALFIRLTKPEYCKPTSNKKR